MPSVSSSSPAERQPSARRDLGLAVASVALAVAGYVAGANGWLHASWFPARSTAFARVGRALTAQAGADAAAWHALHADLDVVRSELDGPAPGVFDLVAALRGLDSAGRPDLARAAAICQKLAWPRCDAASLEAMREQSRP